MKVSIQSVLHIAGFCGDGVVGAGEECDCGSVEGCLAARSCCTPPGLRRGESACRWRRSPAACRNATTLPTENQQQAVTAKKKSKKKTTGKRGETDTWLTRVDKNKMAAASDLCQVLGLKLCRLFPHVIKLAIFDLD